jgi:hypothetical protein
MLEQLRLNESHDPYLQTYSQVARLTAVVAATAARAAAAQTESWAVGLDMAKSLAVIALLGLGGAWKRAAVGLVTGLLAC